MHRDPVDSRAVASVGYDEFSRTLEIEYKPHGAIYAYFDVPLRVYADLRDAQSIGEFVNREVKPNYSFQKVG